MSLPRVLQDLFFLRFFIDFAPVLSHIPSSTSLVNFERESKCFSIRGVKETESMQ